MASKPEEVSNQAVEEQDTEAFSVPSSMVDAANVIMAMRNPETGELKPVNLVSLFGELFQDFGALIQRVEALEKQLKDEETRIVTV